MEEIKKNEIKTSVIDEEIIRGLYSPIRKEYWRKIPKERADEAVMACKQKYSSGDYAFFRFAFLVLMVPFF